MTYHHDGREKGPEQIASLACLASILEVYGYPKPGNVHRLADAKDTSMLHFLASAAAIFSPLVKAGQIGERIGAAEIQSNDAEIGQRILHCVESTRKWGIHQNTNLGIILLLVPLTIAAGAAQWVSKNHFMENLRFWLRQILEKSTSNDAVYVSQAIALASPSGLGTTSRFDVHSKSVEAEIKKSNATLLDLFVPARGYDLIASEYTTAFQITFEESLPFIGQLKNCYCLEEKTVLLFLHLLSSYPDSHILRNKGQKIAEDIQREVKNLGTPENILANPLLLWDFDQSLRCRNINPGTIADLTASGLFVNLLEQFQKPTFNGLDFCQPLMTGNFSKNSLWYQKSNL
ncbi:MAG: triphosphoribosyl-dephospho-CoA synthase [Candidatus Hodarchaeota archaeon]